MFAKFKFLASPLLQLRQNDKTKVEVFKDNNNLAEVRWSYVSCQSASFRQNWFVDGANACEKTLLSSAAVEQLHKETIACPWNEDQGD